VDVQLTLPAHAQCAVSLSSAFRGSSSPFRGVPSKPLLAERWPPGLLRASIRITPSLLIVPPLEKHLPFRKRCPGRWHPDSLWTVTAPVDRVTTASRGRPITEIATANFADHAHRFIDVAMCPCRRTVPGSSRAPSVCSVVWSCHFGNLSRAANCFRPALVCG
jgi:hypothetical protein